MRRVLALSDCAARRGALVRRRRGTNAGTGTPPLSPFDPGS